HPVRALEQRLKTRPRRANSRFQLELHLPGQEDVPHEQYADLGLPGVLESLPHNRNCSEEKREQRRERAYKATNADDHAKIVGYRFRHLPDGYASSHVSLNSAFVTVETESSQAGTLFHRGFLSSERGCEQ